jgi:hypothetical protein
MSSTSKRYSCWKDYFIKSNTLSYSNLVLNKIRKAVDPSRSFISAVNEIANNPGIAFISLDASGEKLQLFHHVSLIGNSWTSDSEKLVGVLGSSSDIVPIQIIQSSIKETKGKSYAFDQFAARFKLKDPLKHDKSAKTEFHNYNILPIPILLTKVFLELESSDPLSVAAAFFQAMYQFDNENLGEEDEVEQIEIEPGSDDQSKNALMILT